MSSTEPATAAGSITLRKLHKGYAWAVTVPSVDGSLEAMCKALATARQLDEELAAVYGTPAERRVRVHVPPEENGGQE
jgi:hypothetical protein